MRNCKINWDQEQGACKFSNSQEQEFVEWIEPRTWRSQVDLGIGAEIYRFIWSQELELVD